MRRRGSTRAGVFWLWAPAVMLAAWAAGAGSVAAAAELRVAVRDSGGARVEIISADGGDRFHLTAVEGETAAAVPYDVRRGATSIQVHTSVGDGDFTADVPQGRYTVTAEKGKEFIPFEAVVEVTGAGASVEIKLRRWIDMAGRGWFSGDTHVHRTVEDLRTLVLTEDLNVALPLTAWVTDSRGVPAAGGGNRFGNRNAGAAPDPKLIEVDPTHVIWPVNTEYEIFTVEGRDQTLGAVFVLDHHQPLELTAPPVRPIAEAARADNALLDLDKHNWPWSAVIVPVMGVNLFELTNNHVWKTEFLFSNFYPEYLPEYMGIPVVDGHYDERGWIEFGFENYYAFLNCGFRMAPSAGTASGVHPVPLGYGRVYVKLDGGFDYDAWTSGLGAGRSFVTTGPMLEVTFDGENPGANLQLDGTGTVTVLGQVHALVPPGAIEIVTDRGVVATLMTEAEPRADGGFTAEFEYEVAVESSGWVAVRCWTERPGTNGRPAFAHSAPVWINVPNAPLRPRREQVEYLIKRVEDEMARHDGRLADEAMAEYGEALGFYRGLLDTARE